MKEYKYYLFTDSKYGSIGTNNERIYNKKQRQENYKVLNKTFFKVMFLCLALTFMALPFWAIFNVDLILWLAFTFSGLTLLFALLFMVFFYLAERDTFIADFKLTKEYSDQVKEYKLKKAKEYTESLFKVIEKYNELNQHKEEKENVEEKPNEVIVKLDNKFTEEIINNLRLTIKENFNNIINFIQTMNSVKSNVDMTTNVVQEKPLDVPEQEKVKEQKIVKSKEKTMKVADIKNNVKVKGNKK